MRKVKKSFISNFIVLGLAFGALFFIGGNVFGFDLSKNRNNTNLRSGCNGQKGIEILLADGSCGCMHDPEAGSGNKCGTATALVIAAAR